jgi:hypothetical protein
MDPDSGNVFRFYEVEYALACAMDGERDVAGIVRWAQEELGLSPSPNEVQTVIATLGDLGYLDVRPPAETVAPKAISETPTKPLTPTAKAAAETKQAAHDEDLARGVIVGKQAAAPAIATEDYELGASGGHVPQKHADLPAAGDVALGASGSTAASKPREAIKTDDIALGASGSSGVPQKADLSMDLSSDFSLNPSDVKEAVRASKVMSAVEVPQDILDTLDQSNKPSAEPKKPEPKVEAKKPEPKVEVKPEPKKPEPKVEAKKKSEAATEKLPDKKEVAAATAKVEAKAESKKQPESKKLESKKPEVAKVEEKKPVVAPPAPKSGVSPVLIVLLVLAVIGAGVFLAWKYLLDKPSSDPTGDNTQPAQPVKKQPPAPPPAPSSKLALDTPAPIDVKSVAGTIEWIEANDKAVKSGDIVVKLAGNAPIQAQIDAAKKDADKTGAALDGAQKEVDAAKDDASRAAAQAKLDAAKKAQDAKQAALTAKQTDLDKFVVKAPADGKLAMIAKVGAKVAESDVVAKITQDPMLSATFTAPGGKYVSGSPATLDIKGGDKKLTCTVADVAGDQVKVVCTADASIPASADVTLE